MQAPSQATPIVGRRSYIVLVLDLNRLTGKTRLISWETLGFSREAAAQYSLGEALGSIEITRSAEGAAQIRVGIAGIAWLFPSNRIEA
jgi:hypothetical protein